MKRTRFTEQQIAFALHQAEQGQTIQVHPKWEMPVKPRRAQVGNVNTQIKENS